MRPRLSGTQPHEPDEGDNDEDETHYLRGPEWPQHQTVDAEPFNEEPTDRVQPDVTEH
jgi:hypothetical protein